MFKFLLFFIIMINVLFPVMSSIGRNGWTSEGGDAKYYTNRIGETSQRGRLVEISSVYPRSIIYTYPNSRNCLGVIYDIGVANGQVMWVVQAGIVDVLIETNDIVLCGQWVEVSRNYYGFAVHSPYGPEYSDTFKGIGIAQQSMTNTTGTNLTRISLVFNSWIFPVNELYVATNGNDFWEGSYEYPMLTLQKAVNSLRTNNFIRGNFNIYLRAGIYTQATVVNIFTYTNRLRISAYLTEAVTISNIDAEYSIKVSNSDNVTISNLFMRAVSYGTKGGIWINGGNNLNIVNNKVQGFTNGIYFDAVSTNCNIYNNYLVSNRNGLFASGDGFDSNFIYSNECGWNRLYSGIIIVDGDQNNIYSNYCYTNLYGVYATSVGTTASNNFYWNTLCSNDSSGLFLNGLTVNNNFVASNNCFRNGSAGMNLWSVPNTTIISNQCWSNAHVGIYLRGITGAGNTGSFNVLISNNICFDNPLMGGIYVGRDNESGQLTNITVARNTLYGNQKLGLFITGLSNLVKNNIIYSNQNVAIYSSNLNMSIVSNNYLAIDSNGLWLWNSQSNTVVNNSFFSNNMEIHISNACYNSILSNDFTSTNSSTYTGYAMFGMRLTNNLFYSNWIHVGWRYILLSRDVSFNKFYWNRIENTVNNSSGPLISLGGASANSIFSNYFSSNYIVSNICGGGLNVVNANGMFVLSNYFYSNRAYCITFSGSPTGCYNTYIAENYMSSNSVGGRGIAMSAGNSYNNYIYSNKIIGMSNAFNSDGTTGIITNNYFKWNTIVYNDFKGINVESTNFSNNYFNYNNIYSNGGANITNVWSITNCESNNNMFTSNYWVDTDIATILGNSYNLTTNCINPVSTTNFPNGF